jgi:glycosyltransferase involved in cell wall biosynthesis
MKVAIVHDDLIQFGGGERLLLALCEMFPNAPIYTSIYDKKLAKHQKSFSDLQIRTSFMQKLPFTTKLRRIYFPLYPLAFESFDLSEFDIVISSSTRFAHGVITKPKTIHICYLNSPPRFLWDRSAYLKYERFGQIAQLLLQPLFSYLRLWDKTAAASRVDYFIANSKNVAKKIKKIYARSSEVVHPFVDTAKFKPDNKLVKSRKSDYYLVVSTVKAW